MQYLEKAQGLQYNSWHTVLASRNRQEEFLMGEGGRSPLGEGSPAVGNRGKLQSLTPDADGWGSVPSWIRILSTLLKNNPVMSGWEHVCIFENLHLKGSHV